MKKILFAFFVLTASMTCVMTGAVIGVAYYQAGYSQGATDEQSCFETNGEACDASDEEMIPTHHIPGRHGYRIYPTHRS